MGKRGSRHVKIFLADGHDLLVADPQELSEATTVVQEDTDGLGKEHRESTPTGHVDVELSQSGAFYDDRAAGLLDAWKGQKVSRIVNYGFEGNEIGAEVIGHEGVFGVSFGRLTRRGLLTKANVEYTPSGQKDECVIVHALGEETADGDTESSSTDHADDAQQVIPITSNSQANPTEITTPIPHGLTSGDKIVISGVSGSSPDINGEQTVTVTSPTTFTVPVDTSSGSGGTGGSFVRADSGDGVVGYLQVSELTLGGHDDVVVKLRHSADDMAWADLITFDAVTSPQSAQRKTAAGTINRYLATSWAFTGTGSGPSITFLVAASRG